MHLHLKTLKTVSPSAIKRGPSKSYSIIFCTALKRKNQSKIRHAHELKACNCLPAFIFALYNKR